jgi:hypothetical protein
MNEPWVCVTMGNCDRCIIDTGCDLRIIGPGWKVLTTHTGSMETVRGKFGAMKSVPMVDAISLLVERITQTPIALLVCYNVLFDAEEKEESLFNSFQLECSGIEVNTKQKLFGFEQNLRLQGDQVIDLECNGRSYWFTNRLPSPEEKKEMLATPERVYFLSKKGSNVVPDKVVTWDTVLKANRLVWTESKLHDWQKRFAFHSATAIKKTFEHTTQHYKSWPMKTSYSLSIALGEDFLL